MRGFLFSDHLPRASEDLGVFGIELILVRKLEPCDRLPVLEGEDLGLVIVESSPDHPVNLVGWEFVDFSAFHPDGKLFCL